MRGSSSRCRKLPAHLDFKDIKSEVEPDEMVWTPDWYPEHRTSTVFARFKYYIEVAPTVIAIVFPYIEIRTHK
jgi:hypothetical protein